jgi:serine/threonine protein kinase/tetratricopeptide (TPR) repeat protein
MAGEQQRGEPASIGDRASGADKSTVLRAGEQSLQSTVDAVPTSAATERSNDSSAGTRFRILRPHARGGLGEVFVARDNELNRDVALKEIRGEHAHNRDSRGRFLLEAEITGGLEHPGIVPVYGLGQYPDGRPYYAMRFIQGDSLKEAISAYHSNSSEPEASATAGATSHARRVSAVADASGSERTLQLRKLLGRFVDVCQAVSYAHSRGVLHRDLKPGNIMLGKYGETLVVDWGLAKVQSTHSSPAERGAGGEGDASDDAPTANLLQPTSGDGVTPTLMGSAHGTPAYMPPEQAVGKLDQLGPASDVYSLGATLYHLLTGRAPFKADNLEDTLKAVQSGTFPLPTEINAHVPKSLEAVCLRAMALKPRDRYASPQDLADDIERYLADEPVLAFPEPFAVRAKRWVRKHPTLTTTTAAVVLLSAVGLGTFSTILSGKNNELTQLNQELQARGTALARTNDELEQANSDLTAANARETDARELAQDNETAAREQSQLALSTLTSVIFDVQRGLEEFPGGGEVRRRLLTTSLEKLQEVSTEYIAQATVDRNTAVALMDMGDVILTFGVGEKSDEISPTASAETTEATANQRSAVTLAQTFYVRAHDIAADLAAADPNSAEAQQDLSLSYSKLGGVHRTLGDTTSALAFYEQCLGIRERLAGDDPHNAEAQRDLSASYSILGDVHLQVGDTPSALAFYEQDLAISERLAAADPDNADAQWNLSATYERLGDVHATLGDISSAREFFKQNLAISERLAAADPDNARAQSDLSGSYIRLGDVHQAFGDMPSALELYEECRAIRERLAADDPDNAWAQRELSVVYMNLGDVHLTLGDTSSALEFYEQCVAINERLAVDDPDNALTQRDLSVVYNRLGDVHLTLGDMSSALEFFEQDLAISERLAVEDPDNAQAQRDLSTSYSKFGDVYLTLGDTSSALKFYEQDLAISERLAADGPDNAEAQRGLMISRFKIGQVAAAMFDYNQAVENYSIAIAVLDRMIANDQNVEQSRQEREFVANALRAVEHEAAQARGALDDWNTFIARPGARSRLSLRIQALASAGRFDEIPQSAAMLRSLNAENAENLYNAACGYALCANAIEPGDGEELTPEQQTQRQEHINLALACLRESIAAGWTDFEHMQQDPDLAVLRDLPEFAELMPMGEPTPMAE